MLSNVPFDLWTSIFGFIKPMQQHETLGALLSLCKPLRTHFVENLGRDEGTVLLNSIVFKYQYRSRQWLVLKKVTDMLSGAVTRFSQSQPQPQPDVQRLLRHAAKKLYIFKDLSQQDVTSDFQIDAQALSQRFPQMQFLRLDGCELIGKEFGTAIFEHLEELKIENVSSRQAKFRVLRRMRTPLRRFFTSTFNPVQLHPNIDLSGLESLKITYPFHSFLSRLKNVVSRLRDLEINCEYWRHERTRIQDLCTLIDKNSNTLERIVFHQVFIAEDLNKLVVRSLVHCSKLQTLTFRLQQSLNDRQGDYAPAMHALEKLPALESLSIEASVSKMTAESCVVLFRPATKLVSFSIKDVSGHGQEETTGQYLVDSLSHGMGSKLRQLRVSASGATYGHRVSCFEALVAAINARKPVLDKVELDLGDGNSHLLLSINQLKSCTVNRLQGPMPSVYSSLRLLHTHKNLHRLVLGNLTLKYLEKSHVTAMTELSSALSVCTCLKELELNQFGIISSHDNDDFIRQFSDALVASNSITHLILGGVEFLMGLPQIRLEPIRSTVYEQPQPVQEPYCRANDVTIETLSHVIKNAKQLRKLSLKSEKYWAKPALLVEAIAHEGCRLMHLDVIVYETKEPNASDLTALLASVQGPELQTIVVRKQPEVYSKARLYDIVSTGIRKRKASRLKDVDVRVEFL